ncbi:MAG: UvrD-helicase domain-containing protein [Fuerstiella sp.]
MDSARSTDLKADTDRSDEVDLEGLTDAQRKAVQHIEGPLMVLAGPGSGKTRVITQRIARLLKHGVKPDEVLALTFTNKAAREMSERVHKLLDGAKVYVSTFHRFCAYVLRRWPDHVGLKQNFTILDPSDQVTMIRRIMEDLNRSATMINPRRVLNRISKARNDLISAADFQRMQEDRIGDPVDTVACAVFPVYEQQLINQNCVDFDALLLHVVEMVSNNDQFREYLDRQFRFVLVDEYQDTNLAQYRIVQAISQHCPNLCVTGDPDQSIYGWRGARPENVSQFESDFPKMKVVSLDQNFRSTGNIVQCANQLISENPRRHRSSLFTNNEAGAPVRLLTFDDAEDEANSVAEAIAGAVRQHGAKFSDFAILYRVNALSRQLETAMSRHGVPFQIASGYSFYERAEIRDLLGYLRVIENPADDSAFVRVVNRPARGIGDKTIQKLTAFAGAQRISLLEAANMASEIPGLAARSRKPLKAFYDLMQVFVEDAMQGKIAKLLERLIAEIDYLKLWTDENEEVDQDRHANIFELVNAARQYEQIQESDDERPSLCGFLELASLTSEADSVDAEKGAVTLMTMHAAKGLEFPVVYIVGLENGLIPHERAVQDGSPASFEEERRLLFVGMTRAMKQLNLTQTVQRTFRGSKRYTVSSSFLGEIDNLQRDSRACDEPMVPAQSVYHENVKKARKRYLSADEPTDKPKIMSAAELEAKLSGGEEDLSSDDLAGSDSAGGDVAGSDSAGGEFAAAEEAKDETDSQQRLGFQKQQLQEKLERLVQKKAATSAAVTNAFPVQTQVRHPRYGRGIVVQVSDGGNRPTVTVQFETDDRVETFVMGHCPLQPIG